MKWIAMFAVLLMLSISGMAETNVVEGLRWAANEWAQGHGLSTAVVYAPPGHEPIFLLPDGMKAPTESELLLLWEQHNAAIIEQSDESDVTQWTTREQAIYRAILTVATEIKGTEADADEWLHQALESVAP